jgi:general secretion pathway protein M
MTLGNSIIPATARFPFIATAVYVTFVIAFGWTVCGVVVDVLDRRSDVAAARDMLERLQGRNRASPDSLGDEIAPEGSPFLEGPTVTVAGASLLERVTSAITKVGGNVLSSQVDVQGEKSKAGFVGLIVNCEADQPALQQLLYDIEAGMPFLFVDQLVVQTPASSGDRDRHMRIMLSVYGQWQGGK